MSKETKPKAELWDTGVSVLIRHPASTPSKPVFLLGLRLAEHGGGTWGFPGGKLEKLKENSGDKSVEACATREMLEETGLEMTNVKFLTITEDSFQATANLPFRQYITIFVTADAVGRDPVAKVMEPDKCGVWEWFSWEQIKVMHRGQGVGPLFLPIKNLIDQRSEVVQAWE